jgi:hypothetical protein
MYVRPALFDLPKVHLLPSQQQTKQFNALQLLRALLHQDP